MEPMSTKQSIKWRGQTDSGASITVTIPNETAVALGLLPRPNAVDQQEADCAAALLPARPR